MIGYDKTLRPVYIVWGLTGLIAIAVIIFIIFSSVKADKEERGWGFTGKIDSVSYTIKGDAYIKTNGKVYYLGNNNWDFDHTRIKAGDSIVKIKNSLRIKLYRNGIKLIEFDGN